jgi:hypothetical protein
MEESISSYLNFNDSDLPKQIASTLFCSTLGMNLINPADLVLIPGYVLLIILATLACSKPFGNIIGNS